VTLFGPDNLRTPNAEDTTGIHVLELEEFPICLVRAIQGACNTPKISKQRKINFHLSKKLSQQKLGLI
jgi:hypothetical protein